MHLVLRTPRKHVTPAAHMHAIRLGRKQTSGRLLPCFWFALINVRSFTHHKALLLLVELGFKEVSCLGSTHKENVRSYNPPEI